MGHFVLITFLFRSTALAKILRVTPFEECKVSWHLRNAGSCATFELVTAVFMKVQGF
jgi:hypothetical protein